MDSGLAISPNGKQIITYFPQTRSDAKIWDLSGNKLTEFKDSYITDDSNILIQTSDGISQLLSASGTLLAKARKQALFVQGISGSKTMVFSPDGKKYLARDGRFFGILNDESGEFIYLRNSYGRKIDFDEKDNITTAWTVGGIRFSPDGQQLLMGRNSFVFRWDMSGKELTPLEHLHIGDIRFSPNGKQFVTLGGGTESDGGTKDAAFLWNLSGRKLASLSENRESVEFLGFSSDSERVATISRDGVARLWNLSGQVVSKFKLRGYL